MLKRHAVTLPVPLTPPEGTQKQTESSNPPLQDQKVFQSRAKTPGKTKLEGKSIYPHSRFLLQKNN